MSINLAAEAALTGNFLDKVRKSSALEQFSPVFSQMSILIMRDKAVKEVYFLDNDVVPFWHSLAYVLKPAGYNVKPFAFVDKDKLPGKGSYYLVCRIDNGREGRMLLDGLKSESACRVNVIKTFCDSSGQFMHALVLVEHRPVSG